MKNVKILMTIIIIISQKKTEDIEKLLLYNSIIIDDIMQIGYKRKHTKLVMQEKYCRTWDLV